MVTLKGLKKTLDVTRNPLTILSLKLGKRTFVKFRNGNAFQLTLQQFRTISYNYPLLQKCEITQLADDLFKVKNDKSEVKSSAHLMPLMCSLMQKYVIEQTQPNSFRLKGDNFEIVGDSAMLNVILEQETGEYDYDYRGKTVLDVGGYQGESAVFFARLGAKKVIVYEPVLANHQYIKENISLNHVNAEVHKEGIGDRDDVINVSYDCQTDTSFGLACNGERTMAIKVRNIAKVIEESNADVAKFDCEGAEESLTRVSDETLRKIPFYIIEVHTPELYGSITEKFQTAGFRLVKQVPKTPKISVLAFERKSS